ncbi:MAG: trigger factor [Chitinispirillales bacterium]|nr:trigger factor [Chitinispirillales bacterium]
MKTTVSEPETWRRVIEFEIPEADINAAVEKKLNEYRREVKLPGFRQGKVPANVVRTRFGDAAKATVVDETIKESYKKACEEHNIAPVGGANVTDMKENEGEPLKFTIETEVDPPIEIRGYDKLKIKPKFKKLKDSEVEEGFQNFLDRFAEFNNVERPSKKGDYVRMEYKKVVIDGIEKAEIQNPAYPVEVGSNSALKDFDKQLVGVSAGEQVEISLKFPKDYADKEAAGKTGEFSVAILAVQEKKLPELNEEFFKKFGGEFDSVDALKEKIRESMEQEENDKAKSDAYKEVIEEIIKDNPFEVPPSRIKTFLDMMQEDFMRYRKPNEPIPTREEIAERFTEHAVFSLKRMRIIDYIADKEKIKATQEEVDKQIEVMAQRYGQEFASLKELFRKNGTTNRIRLEIRERNTLEYLIGEGRP